MRYVLLLLFICNASPNAFAQHVGIKNDVLWDAAMMPNLGVELSMNRHVTVDLWGGGECWDYTNGTQLKLYLFQPELRYWPCQKFEGHFFGIHAHAAHFNVGLISFISELKHTVYRGNLYGGGLSYGYHFAFGKRWGLELTLGIGDETAHKGKGQQYAIADGETDGQSDCIIRRLKLGQVHGLLTLGYR